MINLKCNDLYAKEHFKLVKDCIQKRIRNILKKGINRSIKIYDPETKKNSKKNKKVALKKNLEDYLNSLLKDENLEKLITLKPNQLKSYIVYIKRSNANFLDPQHDSNFVLRNVFIKSCYDNKIFNKLDFVKNIDIDTCPYCNRHYIYYVEKIRKAGSKIKDVKPEIDHFYPKDKYPFFGVSYYNLIPSCKTCNGFGGKEEADPLDVNNELINPYLLENSQFKFSYNIKNINVINPLLDKSSIEVKFKNSISGHLEVFNLRRLYEQHSDHVLELIIKSKLKYSKQYREYLNSFDNLNFNSSEIDRMILGNYSTINEIHKRPLAKLYQDIGKELGLIIDDK